MSMTVDNRTLDSLADSLTARSGQKPPAVFDSRIDWRPEEGEASAGQRRLAAQQALMRAYQNRYVVLPTTGGGGPGIVDRLRTHYDPEVLAQFDSARIRLERELIAPLVREAEEKAEGVSCEGYVAALLPSIRDGGPGEFISFLENSPNSLHHYRNFLIQSSADLLAESSASALSVIGEFGEVQSALFRILSDEFGHGEHGKKHSQLYRATLRSFGLPDEYNGFWHILDTVSLELHNTIHFLFQNPRNFFRQVGFLLYAETSYQRSTADHHRYLRRHFKSADSRYFGVHAHIDICHAAIVEDEVVSPLMERYGEEVGREIVIGAELTSAAFARADAHLANLGRELDGAVGDAFRFGFDERVGPESRLRTPDDERSFCAMQIGGLGVVAEEKVFRSLPEGATGRELVS